jgi:hypothetical protein
MLAGFLLVTSILTIYPMTAHDATTYHLPLAHNLVQYHGFQYDPFVRYSFFPQGGEAVFAIGLTFSSDPAVSAGLEFTMLVATVALVFMWFLGSGRSVAAASIGAFLVLASPIVIIPGTSAYIDVWTMAFLTAGLVVGLLVLDDQLSGTWASLGLVGFLIGQAAAAKYTSVPFGAAVMAGLVVAAGTSRRIWPHLVPAGLGALIAAAPWYAWTFYATGDPVYPFATEVFGNRPGFWTAWQINYQKVASRDAPDPGLVAILRKDLVYLLGRAPNLVVGGLPPLNPLILLGLLAIPVRRWWSARPLVAGVLASLLCLAAWVPITSDPRYLVPALGVLAIAGGLTVEALNRRVGQVHSSLAIWMGRPRSALALVPLAALIVLAPSSIDVARALHRQGFPPVTSDAKQAYRLDRVQCYEGVAYVNQLLGSNYTAYGVGCEGAKFYASGELMGGFFGPAGYDQVLAGIPKLGLQNELLASRLRGLSVGYLVVQVSLSDPDTVTADGDFRLVLAGNKSNLFEVVT